MSSIQIPPLSKHAAIALATATIEKLFPAVEHLQEVLAFLRGMVDELWDWQVASKIEGRSQWTERAARELPSGVFYFSFQARLLDLVSEHDNDDRARKAIGAAIV